MSAGWPAPSPRVRQGSGARCPRAVSTEFLRTGSGTWPTSAKTDPCTICAWTGRQLWELMTAAQGNYSELKNLCIWAKTNGGMGAFYRSQHELVFVYKKGNAATHYNVELGKHGRNRTNLWTYAGSQTPLAPAGTSDLACTPPSSCSTGCRRHPGCVKAGRYRTGCVRRSGTTLVAAHQTSGVVAPSRSTRFMSTPSLRRMQAVLKVDATWAAAPIPSRPSLPGAKAGID